MQYHNTSLYNDFYVMRKKLDSLQYCESVHTQNMYGMITSFTTLTQYNSIFDKKININMMFLLLTAHYYLENNKICKKTHENNIISSYQNMIISGIYNDTTSTNLQQGVGPLFQNLLKYTNLSSNRIQSIENFQIDYQKILPDKSSNYCVIISIGTDCFLIARDNLGYALRDCNKPTQYNFSNLYDLVIHLESEYKFRNILDQDLIEESIHFLIIDKKFKLGNDIVKYI